jgi:hypothetical protein
VTIETKRNSAGQLAPALLATLVLLALIAPMREPAVASGQEPGLGNPALRLDLSFDGPDDACATIEDSREVVSGEEFTVAVCLMNAPEPPAVVTYTLLYDDRVVLAPNVGDCDGNYGETDSLFATPVPGSLPSIEESLDCNPDANAGRTTFGATSLGEGWDCTSGVAEPWGNKPPPTGNAFNGGCISVGGPYTLAANAPVAVVSFRAVDPGRTALTLFSASVVGGSGETTGTCNPVTDVEMLCYGGLVTVSEDPLDTLPEDDGRDIPWTRLAIMGGFALLFLGGVLLWIRRPKTRAPA